MNPSISDYFWQRIIPTWAYPVIVAGMVGFFLYQAINASESIAKAFGPLGRRLYDRKTKLSAKRAGLEQWELADLRRQLEFLSRAVDELRDRDEMTWAFILADQEWHRNYEFMCAERGAVPMPRVSFMDFRAKWVRERPSREHIKSEDTE